MQHIDISTVKAAKATDRKSLAILAYDNACGDPTAADWRSVADILRLALPATKARAADVATDSRFAPWADYDIPATATKKLGKSPIMVLTFADGEAVRVPAVSLPGKPVNIGRAVRVAVAFYQGRIVARYNALIPDNFGTGLLSVCDSEFISTIQIPAVVSAICETTGAEYDPAACSEMIASIAPVAPVKIQAATETQAEISTAPAPVAPAFKIPARFLASSRLVPVAPSAPVAPSCVLRVAA